MTSANLIEYRIEDLTGKQVGKHSQSLLCKTHWGDLLKFQPEENFNIIPYGLDEEEEEWEGETVNLKLFLDKLRQNKYSTWNTMSDLLQRIK